LKHCSQVASLLASPLAEKGAAEEDKEEGGRRRRKGKEAGGKGYEAEGGEGFG